MASSSPIWFIFPVGLVLIGSMFVFTVFLEHRRRGRLERYGITTNATIVTRDEVPSRSAGFSQYYVTYRFNISDKYGQDIPCTGEQKVSKRNYNLLKEGSQVIVKYLKRDPRSSVRLTGKYIDNTDFNLILLIGMGFAVPGLIILGLTLRQ